MFVLNIRIITHYLFNFFLIFSSLFFFTIIEVITPFFFSFVVLFFLLPTFFSCSFSSSPKLSNLFLFLSFSLKLRFVNFDFLFTGDFTLFELVFSFCWSIANFAFCFSSPRRTDCWVIVSAVSEISLETELTPTVPSNEFGGATRKLFFFWWINISGTMISLELHCSFCSSITNQKPRIFHVNSWCIIFAMRLFSIMTNNTRKYHTIAPKWNFLINTQVGNNKPYFSQILILDAICNVKSKYRASEWLTGSRPEWRYWEVTLLVYLFLVSKFSNKNHVFKVDVLWLYHVKV